METTNRTRDPETGDKRNGILYAVMLIAAIAVILFSIIGIATMAGLIPGPNFENGRPASSDAAKSAPSPASPSANPVRPRPDTSAAPAPAPTRVTRSTRT